MYAARSTHAQASRVFPSARWVWYITNAATQGWPEGGMTQADIERWMGAHADWFLASIPKSTHREGNPNLICTWYQEWFYLSVHPASNEDFMMLQHPTTGQAVNGRGIYVENYYVSRSEDPETPFFHLTADFLMETTVKPSEDQITLGIRSSSPRLMDQIARMYRWEYYAGQFDLPNTVDGWMAFSRPEPFNELYVEWEAPPSPEAQYVLEYVSGVAPDPNGFEYPAQWTAVEVISDETNGFHQNGLVRFRPPNRWTQWKRAVLYGPPYSRKHYWVRIRCVTPSSTTPKLKAAFVDTIYMPHPFVKNVGEAIYLGFPQPLDSTQIELLSPGNGGSYVLEYASAVDASGFVTTWTPLQNVTDGTQGLTQDGTITWSMPSSPSWVLGRASSSWSTSPWKYWIRIRITQAPTTPATVKRVVAGGRQLFAQEVYASRYRVRLPGWDPANDRNNDGWVDDSEYANLANPNATARSRWHSRAWFFGWANALKYALNWAKPELKDILKQHFYDYMFNSGIQGLLGLYSDSMVTQAPSYLLTAQIAEPVADVQNWETNWINAHVYMRTLGIIVGGNVSAVEMYAPKEWEFQYLSNGFYTHLYNDYVNHEGWPHGWGTTTEISFTRRLLNFAQETGNGMKQVLQFNMQWNNLLNVGGSTDATGWRRFQEHCLAFFYLVQHPQLSFMSIWNGTYYACVVGNYPIGRMPNVMAYQPTAMLEVDIGQPANSIPHGYSPLPLMYRDGGSFPDNIVVGDTATPVLNNNYAPMAGKPVYPTYVFRLAQGTLPNRPSTTYSVYARRYTKGLVLLKMTSAATADDTGAGSATTHQLPGTYRRVNWDGTLGPPITEITLKGMEGAILVDAVQTSVPNIQLTVSVDKPNPKPLEVVTVTIEARNVGSGATSSIEVRIPISGMTYEQGSLSPQEFTVDASDPSVLKITIPTLGAEQSVTFRFRLVVG